MSEVKILQKRHHWFENFDILNTVDKIYHKLDTETKHDTRPQALLYRVDKKHYQYRQTSNKSSLSAATSLNSFQNTYKVTRYKMVTM